MNKFGLLKFKDILFILQYILDILYAIDSFKVLEILGNIFTHQFSSVAQSCPTLCDPMNHSMPGLPVHHKLPESTQTHVH